MSDGDDAAAVGGGPTSKAVPAGAAPPAVALFAGKFIDRVPTPAPVSSIVLDSDGRNRNTWRREDPA